MKTDGLFITNCRSEPDFLHLTQHQLDLPVTLWTLYSLQLSQKFVARRIFFWSQRSHLSSQQRHRCQSHDAPLHPVSDQFLDMMVFWGSCGSKCPTESGGECRDPKDLFEPVVHLLGRKRSTQLVMGTSSVRLRSRVTSKSDYCLTTKELQQSELFRPRQPQVGAVFLAGRYSAQPITAL